MPDTDPIRAMLAIGRGGPMDGTVLGDADNAEFEVVMADTSRHGYVRTDVLVGHGREQAREYAWVGRRQVPRNR